MQQDGAIQARQLWDVPVAPTSTWSHHCTPFTLPSNGVIAFSDTSITLTTDVVFQPECTGRGFVEVASIEDLRDPFYASVIPQTYVIAAATVIGWILVLMLIITPRTSFLGNLGGSPGFSNGHGIIGGATGGTTRGIGVGSRPWLQKIAALAVAVSLTIATADTMKEAQLQYVHGFMDAKTLRNTVLSSLEIRIVSVLSNIFVWLAQVQTLIRLFPRHKEKVLIKWIGFVLILFDTVFSCINSFMVKSSRDPRDFVDAIPALSYLFELALGLLYAAWVIFYSLTKRRYAFYHRKMRNICLIALLSLVAILTPVVFFVTDVSNEDVASWGDYFRWVGAAAASVVVWEWVERIEALERDEKKDGILGREIFDGDEMLDVTPSEEAVWARPRTRWNRSRGDDQSGTNYGSNSGIRSSALTQGVGDAARQIRGRTQRQRKASALRMSTSTGNSSFPNSDPSNPAAGSAIALGDLTNPGNHGSTGNVASPTPPPPVVSPVSRTDTTSAASTVYMVQYHPAADAPQPVRRHVNESGNTAQPSAPLEARSRSLRWQLDSVQNGGNGETPPTRGRVADGARESAGHKWHSVANPFKRKRASPPPEVRKAFQTSTAPPRRSHTPNHNYPWWDVKHRLGVLAAETNDRFLGRDTDDGEEGDQQITIIPAMPRGSGRAWTPEVQTEERSTAQQATRTSVHSNARSETSNPQRATARASNVTNFTQTQRTGSAHVNDGVQSLDVPQSATVPGSACPSPRPNSVSPGIAGEPVTVVPAPKRALRGSALRSLSASGADNFGEGSSNRAQP